MFVSEIYIEDCFIYRTDEYSRTHGSTSAVSNEVISGFTWDNTVDWEFECEFKTSGQGQRIDIVPPSQSLNYHIGMGKQSGGSIATVYVGKNGGGEYSASGTSSISNNTYYPFRIVKENNTIKYYFNEVLQYTDSTYAHTWIDNYSTETFKFTQWRASTVYARNIKIKAL